MTTLKERWQKLLDEEGKVRIRAAATKLGVSEAELLATGLQSEVQRIAPQWKELIQAIADAGPVMALTRNDFVVLEKTGSFENLTWEGPVGITVGKMINLRMLLNHWYTAYAVVTPRPDGSLLRSFQIFDAHGDAVTKLYLREDEQIKAFEQIRERFAFEGDEIASYTPAPTPPTPTVPAHFDRQGFQKEWTSLTDIHGFSTLLNRYKIERLPALHQAPEGYAWRVQSDVLEPFLQGAVDQQIPIMIFVQSRGNVQIHSGQIHQLRRMGPFFNILDGEELNLHFMEHGVDEAWVVRKPGEDGVVTSLEFYHKDGTLICQFFGERSPGENEREDWRTLLTGLTHYTG